MCGLYIEGDPDIGKGMLGPGLKNMCERRDPSSDYMFPSEDGGHIGSYRKQWEHAREALKAWHIKHGKKEEFAAELCDELGFHHLRHYFGHSWEYDRHHGHQHQLQQQ